MAGSGRGAVAASVTAERGMQHGVNLLDRLRLWFAKRRGDPMLSSPPDDAQLELTSREQAGELLDEGKTPRDRLS